MEILNPAGLLWLGALPLLLLPYLLRERPRRRVVSALFLYRGITPATRLRLGGRPKLEPLFFLQLLLLLVAVATLVRPAVKFTELRSSLVLDNSASLQARGGLGESRFEIAKRRAGETIAGDPAGIWDLFTLSPEPTPIDLGLSRREALERIAQIEPGNCAHPGSRTIESFLTDLAAGGFSTIHVVTDRGGTSKPPFEITTIGEPATNLAITSFTGTPDGFAAKTATAAMTAANYSNERAQVAVSVENARSGEPVASGKLEIPPGESLGFSTAVPAGITYRARIEATDALAVDNQAVATIPLRSEKSLLLVSSTGSGLEAVPGLHLEVVSPADYRPSLAKGRDLVIFHLSAPIEPPSAPALYLLPPDAPFLPAASGDVSNPEIAFPEPNHPIVRYLNAGALHSRRSLIFRSSPGWETLAISPSGPALLARGSPERAVVSGIDLLPYLGERNRPISILTLNLLSWLSRSVSSSPETAACPALGASESDLRRTVEISLPEGSGAPAAAQTVFRPLWPSLAFAALGLLALEGWLERRAPGAWRPGPLANGFRLAVAALLAAAALDPVRAVPAPPPDPVILVDVSRSVPQKLRAERIAEIARLVSPSAPAVAFAAGSATAQLSTLGSSTPERVGADATDLESALLAAGTRAPEETPMLVLTDGWETRGNARHAIDLLRRRRIRVYPIAVGDEATANVEVERLSLPLESLAGKSARAEVLFRNGNPTVVSGRLTLRLGSRTLLREVVKLAPGENLVARPVLLAGQGLLEFSAALDGTEDKQNRFTDDDLARAWVSVRGRKQALLLGRSRSENRYIERALGERGFAIASVSVHSGDPVPDLRSFGAIVLNDVALDDLPRGFAGEIRDVVRGGGGLVMVGGPRSFGLGGYLGSAVEEALPVRMKPPSREETRSSVALVIDKSGSMREERRMSYAREAARQLASALEDRDRLAVIGFDREPFVVIPLSEVGDIREDFDKRIWRLKPAGGTRLYPALVEAERQLLGEKAKRRHIIVLSDGLSEDAESGEDRRRYYDLALALGESRITISTIALGRDADSDFLERLASFGRGAFHATSDPSNLPELFLGELEERGKERTLREAEIRPSPSTESPLVGEIARAQAHWPTLLGLVETELKRGARLDVGSSAPNRPPLIASWQYGAGRSVAVTTDADGRWSDRWVRWSEWSRLWAGILGWLLPGRDEPNASFAVGVREGSLVIDYERFHDDPGDVLSASITGPNGIGGEFEMMRLAPGHYQGSFPTRTPGDYRIEIRGPRGAITQSPLGYSLSPALNAERPRSELNWPLLEELAHATGGRMNPAPGEIIPAPAPSKPVPLALDLLPMAILLFIADLVVRRLGQRAA